MYQVKDTKTGKLLPTEFEIRAKAIDLANYLNRECREAFRYVVEGS